MRMYSVCNFIGIFIKYFYMIEQSFEFRVITENVLVFELLQKLQFP